MICDPLLTPDTCHGHLSQHFDCFRNNEIKQSYISLQRRLSESIITIKQQINATRLAISNAESSLYAQRNRLYHLK